MKANYDDVFGKILNLLKSDIEVKLVVVACTSDGAMVSSKISADTCNELLITERIFKNHIKESFVEYSNFKLIDMWEGLDPNNPFAKASHIIQVRILEDGRDESRLYDARTFTVIGYTPPATIEEIAKAEKVCNDLYKKVYGENTP